MLPNYIFFLKYPQYKLVGTSEPHAASWFAQLSPQKSNVLGLNG